MLLTTNNPDNPNNNFRIIRSELRSQFVREFIGEREFQDISVIQTATGVNLNQLTKWRWVNWIVGKALGFFQWSITGILNFAIKALFKIVNFDWLQSYKEIGDTIKANNLAITGQFAQVLGSAAGWTASIALAGRATIKFPVLGARVGLALAEEGGQTLRNQIGSFLENVTEAIIDNITLTVFSGYRRMGELILQITTGQNIDWESREPWSIAKETEKQVEKIENDYVRTFVQQFGDGFLDAIMDIAYVVSFTIDDHFLATQAAMDMMETTNEPVRRIEVFPDRENEEESIILEDTQNNVELSLNNYLSTHEVIRNKDVGVVVGQTYDEWYSLKPQSRKLIIEFRGKEKPPFLNGDGTLAQRVQISIPNVKPGVGWSQLKTIKKFTWGNYMARGVFSDRRQMTVWGSSEAEAKSTLLTLAQLSASDLVQVSVSHPEIQNIRRKKEATLVYPAYATLLVRKTTIGANDTTLIDGQNKAMARMRVELWKDDPPNNWQGFL